MRGLGVTLGYWNRPEETAATFDARIEGDDGEPFMRTGDFGFLHEGNLYLTGRLKETMIFWGRNVYPQDLEHTVAGCHESLKLNGGAAFTVERDGGEHLVIVQEVVRPARLDLPAIAASVRQAIMAEHGVPLSALVFIRPGVLPKTSSGKIQRGEARKKFLAGELDALGQWSSTRPPPRRPTATGDAVRRGRPRRGRHPALAPRAGRAALRRHPGRHRRGRAAEQLRHGLDQPRHHRPRPGELARPQFHADDPVRLADAGIARPAPGRPGKPGRPGGGAASIRAGRRGRPAARRRQLRSTRSPRVWTI